MHTNFNNRSRQLGFSLIELVIFIVILAIALASITLVYINTTRQSADPLIRIKSIELAQLMLNEILLKNYDEGTPSALISADTFPDAQPCVGMTDSATSRCNSGEPAASDPLGDNIFGLDPGETNRIDFDDVDDYQGKLYCGDNVVSANTGCVNINAPLVPPTCEPLLDESGVDISSLYAGYSVCINVSFAGGAGSEISFGLPVGQHVFLNDAKKIDVTVTDIVSSKISLTAYSLNY